MRPRHWLLLLGLLLIGGVLGLQQFAGPGWQAPPEPERGATSARAEPATEPQREAAAPREQVAPAAAAARLRVLDVEQRPVPGAELIELAGGATVATADAAGEIGIGGLDLSQHVVAASGYLLRWLEPGSTEFQQAQEALSASGRCEVVLVPDAWTIPFAFEFVTADGRPLEHVRVRLQALAVPPPSAFAPQRLRGQDPRRAAWVAHAQLALLPHLARFGGFLGLESTRHEFHADGHLDLRFVAEGQYLLQARGPGELVAREQVFVRSRQLEPLRVVLAPGPVLRGTVVTTDNAPLPAAQLVVADGGFAAAAGSSHDGGFDLGPLPRVATHLIVSHAEIEPQRVGPFLPGPEPVRVVVALRPQWHLSGQVLSRASRGPVAQADLKLEWHAGGQELRTDAEGRFELATRAPGGTLTVTVAGHLRWVEILDAGAPPLRIKLWPGTPKARAEAGLTALLAGRVEGPDGSPRPGVPIQILGGGSAAPPAILTGRAVVEGGQVTPPLFSSADGDGRFELEWPAAATLRLVVADGGRESSEPLVVEAIPGRIRTDLVLRTLR